MDQALSYEAVDEQLAQKDEVLTPLFEMLERLIAKRESKTPPLIELDEVSLRVLDGKVQVVRHDANSRSSAGIREAMVLANETAGERLQAAALPAIFRGQEPSEIVETEFEFSSFGMKWAHARERRMGMNRAQLVKEAKPHFGLGAEAYAQSSSPLRRLADLVNHWQLWSTISDEAPLDVKRINEALQFAEHGERRGRKIERRANRYWTLEAIRQAGKGPFKGWVLANEPYPKIGLEDWMLEVEHKDAVQWNVGDELEIEVVRVDPRDDRLKLRCVNISVH